MVQAEGNVEWNAKGIWKGAHFLLPPHKLTFPSSSLQMFGCSFRAPFYADYVRIGPEWGLLM